MTQLLQTSEGWMKGNFARSFVPVEPLPFDHAQVGTLIYQQCDALMKRKDWKALVKFIDKQLAHSCLTADQIETLELIGMRALEQEELEQVTLAATEQVGLQDATTSN
jgi:hypothetical protein